MNDLWSIIGGFVILYILLYQVPRHEERIKVLEEKARENKLKMMNLEIRADLAEGMSQWDITEKYKNYMVED